ncbi:hypothetical protein HAX54_022991 [Datura stramonium]|uniref:Helicase C-terminal domain-containing protein n=1 Tax=Datura stramonium TaxID=4076 RepID=A0ABS8UVJ8_DATST|nr:hypothetical protein [Datura stramonium]
MSRSANSLANPGPGSFTKKVCSEKALLAEDCHNSRRHSRLHHTVTMRKDSLDVFEYDYYKSLYNRSQAQFNTLASGNTEAADVEQSCGICVCSGRSSSYFLHPCVLQGVFDGFCESMREIFIALHVHKPLTFDFTANDDKGDSNSKPTAKGFRSSSILNKIQLDKFKTSTKISYVASHVRDLLILLMSFKAGGVALNLTVASHVFLMDPWWNPAVEQQAQDRIHRIGQHKTVRIVRFVIEDTIEEKILELQEKKKLLFERKVSFSYSRLDIKTDN